MGVGHMVTGGIPVGGYHALIVDDVCLKSFPHEYSLKPIPKFFFHKLYSLGKDFGILGGICPKEGLTDKYPCF